MVIGPALVVPELVVSDRPRGNVESERAAYHAARARAVAALDDLAKDLESQGMGEQAGILQAQALMLQDPGFDDMVGSELAAGLSPTEAVSSAAEHFASMFEALEDPYMAGRATDVRDAAGRLVDELQGRVSVFLPDRPSIVVARELTPSQTAGFDRRLVLGFATEAGSATSHTAILARALSIPAVVGVPDLRARVETGVMIALNGDSGEILIDPSDEDRQTVSALADAHRREHARLAANRDLPAQTLDGHRIVLAANIGSPDDVPAALAAGAEGVGLFRTEFLFAEKASMPTEEEQVTAYRTVLAAMSPHRVVVRTLDIGGDKPLPFLPPANEANPFLGLRGIRYTLHYPELLQTQIRALLAAAPAGNLSIMLPMVSDRAEIERVLDLLADLQHDTGGQADLGIMVEVPAAALLAEQFARYAAFFSVGSNDLTQYALAVDRGNETVASLYRSLHPGVLRLLDLTVRGAHAHGRWAGVCGEMAGDLTALPILVGLGFDELSMTPSRIPAARDRIRSLRLHVVRGAGSSGTRVRGGGSGRGVSAK